MNYSWRTEFAPPVAVLGTPEAQRYTALAEAMPGPYPFDWLVMARPLQTLQQPPATHHEKALLPDTEDPPWGTKARALSRMVEAVQRVTPFPLMPAARSARVRALAPAGLPPVGG